MDFVLTKDDIFLFWMSNLYISIILHSLPNLPIMFLLVRMTKALQVHLHIIVRICTSWLTSSRCDSFRPQETESRRRVFSTADKTESSLCVSVFSVFSQISDPLSDSLLCWGYPPKNMSVHVYLNDLCFILRVPLQKIFF